MVGGVAWYLVTRNHFSLSDLFSLLLVILASLVGLGAGIVGAITRKRGERWWPLLIGILPGTALIVFLIVGIATAPKNPCAYTYC